MKMSFVCEKPFVDRTFYEAYSCNKESLEKTIEDGINFITSVFNSVVMSWDHVISSPSTATMSDWGTVSLTLLVIGFGVFSKDN